MKNLLKVVLAISAAVLAAFAMVGTSSSQAATVCGDAPAGYQIFESNERIIQGTRGDDFICAGDAANFIKGLSGNDIIFGGGGRDWIQGGAGNDTLHGGEGDDGLFGAAGNDKIFGDEGTDLLKGGRGRDQMNGGADDDRVYGSIGDDKLFGGPGTDVVKGGGGIDIETQGDTAQPNILLLIADDFGVDVSPCYSATPATAPRLTALCDQMLIFDNVWSSPTCSPTRSGILTGRHGFRTGIEEQVTGNNGLQIGADEVTLPRLLDATDSGYAHASFGKWHLGGDASTPNDMGWSHFSGLLQGGLQDYEDWDETTNGVTERVTTYSTTEIINDTYNWIDSQSSPWLAWVAFNAPHTPFHLPPANLHSQDGLSGSAADIDANPDAYYDAAVEALDTEIGRLLDSIPPEELANTTIIFMGDNGTPAQVSDFDRTQSKGSLYEGGVHVPMMMWGAGVETSGRTDALVGTIDLNSTILELAGVTWPAEALSDVKDSRSFAPLLDVGGSIDDEIIFTQINGTETPRPKTGWAARTSRYKLIRFELDNSSLFFDLEADRTGTTPISGSLSVTEQAAFDELDAHIDALLTS